MTKIVRESIEFDKTKEKIAKKFLNEEFDEEFYKLLNSHEDYKKYTDEWMSPPEKFEREYNVSGFSQKYKMPYGWTEPQLEKFYKLFLDEDDSDFRVRNKILYDLTELNPELKKISEATNAYKSKELRKISGVSFGATSRMKIRDIYFFIVYKPMGDTKFIKGRQRRIFTINGKYSKYYTNLMRILENNNVEIEWFPAPKTILKIIDKLNIDYKIDLI